MFAFPVSMFGDLNPLNLNPFAWYKADDLSTLTATGSDVDQWRDKSGNGHHLNAVGSARPKTGIATIGGRNVISFDGTDDQIFASLFNMSIANVSYVYVRRINTVVSGDRIFAIKRLTTNTGLLNASMSGTTDFQEGFRFIENAPITWTPSGVTSPHSISLIKSGASSQQVWDDGVAQTPETTTITDWTSDELVLGSQLGGSFADVDMAELLIFDRALSTNDRLALENYTLNYWSI